MNDDTDELEAVPWDDVLRQLKLHAERRMRMYKWQGRRGGRMPEGAQPEDIVHGAVIKFLEGKRQWNRSHYPRIEDFLRTAIDSDIDHLANAWANRHLRAEAVLSEGDRRRVAAQTDPATAPDTEILERETLDEAGRIVLKLEAALEDEPQLVAMLRVIRDGTTRRAELARALGITPAEADNIRRRLQRRLNDLPIERRGRSKK